MIEKFINENNQGLNNLLSVKKEGNKLQKKRVVALFLVFSIAFSILVISNLALASSDSDTLGCCTVPGHADNCLEMIARSSCGGVDDETFHAGVACSAYAYCGTSSGCCKETCTSVSSAAECTSPETFVEGADCNDLSECARGCCQCRTQPPNPVCQVAVDGLTESECIERCNRYTGLSHLLLFDLTSCACADKPTNTITLRGVVKDAASPNPAIDGATVTIPGVGSTTTDSSGAYSILSVPVGTHLMTVTHSNFITNNTRALIVRNMLALNFFLTRPLNLGFIRGTITGGDTGDDDVNDNDILVIVSGARSVNIRPINRVYETPYLTTGSNYKVQVDVAGYESDPVDRDIQPLVAGANPNNDFVLIHLKEGVVTAIVTDKEDNTPLQGVTVTTDTNQFCTTDNTGSCHIDEVYVGSHTITASKELYATATATADVGEYGITININLTELEACTYNSEKILNGSCAVINKPARCIDAAEGPKGTVVMDCDECACNSGYKCLSSGYCIPESDFCSSDCVLSSTGMCDRACNGSGGCTFYSDVTMKACDGQAKGTIKQIDDLDINCCGLEAPRTLTAEVCTTDDDKDGDRKESREVYKGDKRCFDDDCFGQVCDTDGNICLPVKIGDVHYVKCLQPACDNGLVSASCTCGSETAEAGKYCCQLDEGIYSEEDYADSVCGSNSLCSISGGQCCDGANCVGGRDSNLLSQNILNSCSVAGEQTICCPAGKCLPKPPATCEYPFQCNNPYTGENYAASIGLTGCNIPCENIPSCISGLMIGSIHNSDACKCGDPEVIVEKNTANKKKYCCEVQGEEGKTFLTNKGQPCPTAANKGVLTGTIRDRVPPQGIIKFAKVHVGDYSKPKNSESVLSGLDGKYEIRLPAKPGYDVWVTREAYKESEVKEDVEIKGSETTSMEDIFMDQIDNPCDDMPYEMQSFIAFETLGDVKKVNLEWIPPACTNIVGYVISREGGDEGELELPINKKVRSYIDTNVEYDTEYTYTAVVDYGPDDQGNKRQLSSAVTASVVTGHEVCEGTYKNGMFYQFCSIDKTEGYVCGAGNRKLDNPVEYCTTGYYVPTDESYYVCSGPGNNGRVACRDRNICNVESPKQDALPFGLYFEEETCLGEIEPHGRGVNHCYYDYTDTTIDSCYTCDNINSCYGYNSESACLQDNCMEGGDESYCKWISTEDYAEFGKGFCYDEREESSDYCNLCQADNPLFFNTGCNQEICSSLGNCLEYESSCISCDDATCAMLDTEEKCTGDQEIEIVDAVVTESNDVCGLGRCKWNDAEQKCYKDGNDNGIPDCYSNCDSDIGETGEICIDGRADIGSRFCVVDTDEPVTVINEPQGSFVLGAADLELEFVTEATYEFSLNGGRDFWYCIDMVDECVPYIQRAFYTPENNVILQKEFLASEITTKGVHYIRFYSVDKFFNQESVKSIPFYADIFPPEITLDYTVHENVNEDAVPTVNTLSRIVIDIEIDEKATCTTSELEDYAATEIVSGINHPPSGEEIESWTIDSTINDGIYQYTITCVDKSGNSKTEIISWENLIIDAYRNIEVISPPNVTNDPDVLFKIETADSSNCELNVGASIVDGELDITNNARTYEMERTLASRSEHYQQYWWECEDIAQPDKVDTAEFAFTVDLTPPEREVILVSGDRIVKVTDDDEYWHEEFNKEVEVSLECTDPEISGSAQVFGVDETSLKACLTDIYDDEPCEPTEVVDALDIVNETSRLCYTCADNGGNGALRCGTIKIDTKPPSFNVQIKDNNKIAHVLIRETPTRYYDVTLQSSEKLNDLPVLRYSVADKSLRVALEQLSEQVFKGKIFIPSTPEFDNIEGEDNAEFFVGGYDIFDNLGTEITSGKKFTIDTLPPKKPKLAVRSDFSDEDPFWQAGIEGEYRPNRKIKIIYTRNKTEDSQQWKRQVNTTSAVRPNSRRLVNLNSSTARNKIIIDKPNLSDGNYIDFEKSILKDDNYQFYEVLEIVQLQDDTAEVTLDRDLPDYDSDKYSGKVESFDNAVPSGWFDLDVPLVEGTTWFYAFAYDEAGNEGEHTEIKKVIRDNTKPKQIVLSPANNSNISTRGLKVQAVIKDENSGINCARTKLKLDSTEYNYASKAFTCTGKKTVLIRLKSVSQLSEGGHTAELTAYDKAGNEINLKWNFVIDSNAPGAITPVTHSNCLHGMCYTNNVTPVIRLEFAEQGVNINSVRLLGSYTQPTYQSVSADIGTAYNVIFDQNGPALSEGLYVLEVTMSPAGKNYVNFVVDTTDPTLTFHLPIGANDDVITAAGIFYDDNVFRLEFEGDIVNINPLDYYNLPEDMVDSSTFHYSQELQLVIPAGTDNITRSVKATLYDKAGNSKQIEKVVKYDQTEPEFMFSEVLVQAGSKKLKCPTEANLDCTISSKYFKTNAKVVTISGETDRPVQDLNLATDIGRIIPVPFSTTKPYTFNVQLDLFNSQSDSPIEGIALVAKDLGGNIGKYKFDIELDVYRPRADIFWR